MAPKRDRTIRRARKADLDAIWHLETVCFEPHRRVEKRSLKRSLASAHQRAWVLDGPRGVEGALIVWVRPRTWRVYDVAVHPRLQGQGWGSRFMDLAEREARRAGARRVALEAATTDERLLAFYERRGYAREILLRGFYGGRRNAWRLVRGVVQGKGGNQRNHP